MEAITARTTVNDDAAAALRRGFGFAALFGLAGMAAIACTARAAPPPANAATDRLMAQEALWSAEATGAPAPAFPPALLKRAGDPAADKAMADARRRLVADRAAAAARRDVVLRGIDDARAERDLNESRTNVVLVKLRSAFARREAARKGGDQPGLAAVEAEVRTLKVDAAKAARATAAANGRINALGRQMAVLATQDRTNAERNLADVRSRLRGG